MEQNITETGAQLLTAHPRPHPFVVEFLASIRDSASAAASSLSAIASTAGGAASGAAASSSVATSAAVNSGGADAADVSSLISGTEWFFVGLGERSSLGVLPGGPGSGHGEASESTVSIRRGAEDSV